MSDESPYARPDTKKPGLVILMPRLTPRTMSQEVLWAEIVRHTIEIGKLQTEAFQRMWAFWGLSCQGWH